MCVSERERERDLLGIFVFISFFLSFFSHFLSLGDRLNSTEALTKEGEEFAKNTQLREIKEVRGGKGERVCVGEERGSKSIV